MQCDWCSLKMKWPVAAIFFAIKCFWPFALLTLCSGLRLQTVRMSSSTKAWGKPQHQRSAGIQSVGGPAGGVVANGQSRGPSRRKMGPPQRKLNQDQIESERATGRVSVYCVGAEIDLVALRAYVFRRGFGSSSTPRDEGENPELVLARSRGSIELEEDEMLHVTNAPLYVTGGLGTQRGEGVVSLDRDRESSSGGMVAAAAAAADLVRSDAQFGTESDSVIDAELKLKEQLLMATQDIFYVGGTYCLWSSSSQLFLFAHTNFRPSSLSV